MSHSDFDVVTGPSMVQRRGKSRASAEVNQLSGEHQYGKPSALKPAKVVTPGESARANGGESPSLCKPES
jgi:hypothetical protein